MPKLLINHQHFITRCHTIWAKGRDSSVDITPTLRAGRSGDRIPAEARFSALVQTGPEAHPASHTMGIGSLARVNRPGRGVDHPPNLTPRFRVELYLYSPSGPGLHKLFYDVLVHFQSALLCVVIHTHTHTHTHTHIYIYIYTHIYTHIQDDQNVCTPDDYRTKNTQKYFKQLQSLTMIT
jgi:hypothetical protein